MIGDLLLGLRLAVGGGRVSGQALLRLGMTTLGVALVVAVLLPAASVTHLVEQQNEREAAQTPLTEPRTGVDPLYQMSWFVDAGADYVHAIVVAPGGPNAPVPPGLSEIPAPGDLVASPGAAEFLATPEGEVVRSRLGGTIVGEVGKPGLGMANDRIIYLGTSVDRIRDEQTTEKVYAFGGTPPGFDLTTTGLLAPIAVVLLLPLFVFVTTASRMGAAQRDRRLAALRLLGVSGRRIRRIAAAESLLGAALGLLVGGALFVALRPLIGHVEPFGLRFFAEDFVPPWPFVVLIALLVPALAIGAAIFGLRRTLLEPLGVVRQSKPIRRRMAWRWAITALGALLTGSTLAFEEKTDAELVGLLLATGSALLLIGVAAVLPWAVERIVSRLRGGPPAWQLAIRRLQLESGTASRVVSGLVIVLAGSIFIQNLLASLNTEQRDISDDWAPTPPVVAEISGDDNVVDEADRLLNNGSTTRQTHRVTMASARPAEHGETVVGASVEVGDCAALATRARLGSCADGDVFLVGTELEPGEKLRFISLRDGEPVDGPAWTIPAEARRIPADQPAHDGVSTILVTPSALGSLKPPESQELLYVTSPGDPRDEFHAAALALSPLGWQVTVRPGSYTTFDTERLDDTASTMRAILLIAALFVLAVAALSLLLLSIEQIVERRRPLAALAAAGVPRAVLARGALWQNAIPVTVGVVLAITAGIAITVPTMRYVGLDFSLDIAMLGMVSGAAVLAVLATTVLTLPLLRQATKLESLRAE